MHHLLVNTAPARVAWPRAHREIFVAEFAPDAQNLDALGFVGLNQEFEFHWRLPPSQLRPLFLSESLTQDQVPRRPYMLTSAPVSHLLYCFLGGRYFFWIDATIT